MANVLSILAIAAVVGLIFGGAMRLLILCQDHDRSYGQADYWGSYP